MRRAAAMEALALFDRVCRLGVLAGLGWGLFVLAKGDFRRDVGAWQVLAWAPTLVLAGVVGMGLAIALRAATERSGWG